MSYKISDITKALKKAGFVKIDAIPYLDGKMPMSDIPNRYFFKYKGSLHINGHKVGFCINSKADAKIFGNYTTSATDEIGCSSEVNTSWAEFFFPRLFGYINGMITEAEIIKEVCG